MKRKAYLAIVGGVILCLALIFTYSGVQSDEAGAAGTSMLSCGKSPISPEADVKIAPSAEPNAQESQEAMILLAIDDVYYSESWGSDRWRTTFEVRVMLPSGEDVRETSQIAFYYKRQHARPLVYEEDWIHISQDDQYADHGLFSYESEWRDRKNPEVSRDPVWFLAHVINPTYGIDDKLIWAGDFSEADEEPKEVWDRAAHLRYEPESARVLASQSVDYQLND